MSTSRTRLILTPAPLPQPPTCQQPLRLPSSSLSNARQGPNGRRGSGEPRWQQAELTQLHTRPGPLQTFSQRNYRSITSYCWLERGRETSSRQGNKRPPTPQPTEVPRTQAVRRAEGLAGPRPHHRPGQDALSSQCAPSEAAREITLASASLSAPPAARSLGEGPSFHNDKASCFLFVLFFA